MKRKIIVVKVLSFNSTWSKTPLTSAKHVTSYSVSGYPEHVDDVYVASPPLRPTYITIKGRESLKYPYPAALLYLVTFPFSGLLQSTQAHGDQ